MERSCDSLYSTKKWVHIYAVKCANVTVLVCLFKDENSEKLECSAINDTRSVLDMFLTDLYVVEGLETETLK